MVYAMEEEIFLPHDYLYLLIFQIHTFQLDVLNQLQILS
jgi:hypothetical protein